MSEMSDADLREAVAREALRQGDPWLALALSPTMLDKTSAALSECLGKDVRLSVREVVKDE